MSNRRQNNGLKPTRISLRSRAAWAVRWPDENAVNLDVTKAGDASQSLIDRWARQLTLACRTPR